MRLEKVTWIYHPSDWKGEERKKIQDKIKIKIKKKKQWKKGSCITAMNKILG